MIKIFAHSFTFKSLFSLKNSKLSKMIGYFLFLVLLISFPLNYQIIQNDGFKGLNSITYSIRKANPDWLPDMLPSDMSISRNGLDYVNDATYTFLVDVPSGKFTVIINPPEAMSLSPNTIALEKTRVVYINENMDYLVGSYQTIDTVVDFAELKTIEKGEAVNIFLNMIDNAFNPYAVFYSVMFNTFTQLIMNVLLIIVLAAIFLLIRINYKKVTDFFENIKIITASMTIPAILSFAVGLFGFVTINTFSVVLFQMLTPLIALMAIYKGSKEKEPIIKHL